MDLNPARRAARLALAPFVLAAALGASFLSGCESSDAPFELADDAIDLPATMMEAYRLANRLALDESERAYVTKMGGGFTLMNHLGQARNHSFVFHAREGIGVSRRFIIHLIAGAPWIQTSTVNSPPQSFADVEALADSDEAIAAVLEFTAQTNTAFPDSIPLPEGAFDDDAFVYAAKILSNPQWPEPNDTSGESPRVAWRVDFLTTGVPGGGGVPVPYSLVRFYLDPVTLEVLAAPIKSGPGGELYPWP